MNPGRATADSPLQLPAPGDPLDDVLQAEDAEQEAVLRNRGLLGVVCHHRGRDLGEGRLLRDGESGLHDIAHREECQLAHLLLQRLELP